MKVLIEGNPVFITRSGVGQYTYRLLDNLFQIDKKNRYYLLGFLFVGKHLEKPFSSSYKNLSYRMVRYIPSKVANVMARKVMPVPVDLVTGLKPDVVLFTNFVRSPLVTKAKSVVIVYDMSFELFSQHSGKKNVELLKKQVPKSVKKSDFVITISENSKREILDHYKVDSAKIGIVNPAIDHTAFRPQSKQVITKVKNKYNITGNYILYTGTLEPRKNIVGILEAYDGLPKNLKGKYTLVLAGGKGWLDAEIQQKLEAYDNLDIIKTGYVPDEDLPGLYSGASVFVYPSFYEGFGMPPLEAMACGCPVITSNNSSLPEVVGQAGIMIDAKDTPGLVKNISKVLTNESLRAGMVKEGLKQARKFSWQKSAKELKAILTKLTD